MNITKSRLKQIIKEELIESMTDSDGDAISDEKELAIVEDPFREIWAQLWELSKQQKAKGMAPGGEQYWEVNKHIMSAVEHLEQAESLAKSLDKSLLESRWGGGSGWAPQTLMRHPDVEAAFSNVNIRGVHAGHVRDIVDAYDRSAIESPRDQLSDLNNKLSRLTHFERSTSYAAVGAILDQLRRQDSFT